MQHHAALLLLLISCLVVQPARADELPVLGDPSSALMSASQEHRLGRDWLRNLRRQTSILADPLVQEYTESLVYRLASYSNLEEPNLAIVVVNSQTINAFAVPGGVIGINAGLFLNAQSEAEVAGVMAHEIAHVSQRHFARRYMDSKKINTAMLAGVLASLALAIAGDGEAGMAGIAATQAGAIQAQLAYSRQNEREADRVGMQTLAAAGVDPNAMPRFFERMHNSKQFAGDPPEFLLTHPVTEERIADSRARARNLPAPTTQRSASYGLVRARLQAKFIASSDRAIDFFQHHQNNRRPASQQAARYGLALSYLRNEQYSAAHETLQALLEERPNELWFRLGLAEVALAEGDYPQAIKQAKRVLAVSPKDYAAAMLLSRAYLRHGQPRKALPLLKPLTRKRADNPQVWDLIADAYGNSGDTARALHARAESRFLRGYDKKAQQRMAYALKESKGRFALHSKLNARKKTMQRLAEEKF